MGDSDSIIGVGILLIITIGLCIISAVTGYNMGKNESPKTLIKELQQRDLITIIVEDDGDYNFKWKE